MIVVNAICRFGAWMIAIMYLVGGVVALFKPVQWTHDIQGWASLVAVGVGYGIARALVRSNRLRLIEEQIRDTPDIFV